MPKISHTGPIAAPILALIALVALVACGGGRDDAPTFIPPTATSAAVAGTAVPVATAAASPVQGNVEQIGWLLYTDYLIPFEVASVLLLVAMVGAIVLAKRELS